MKSVSTHPNSHADVTPDRSRVAAINRTFEMPASVHEHRDLQMTRHVEIVRSPMGRGMAVIETYVDNCLMAISEAFPVDAARVRAYAMRAAKVIDHTAPIN